MSPIIIKSGVLPCGHGERGGRAVQHTCRRAAGAERPLGPLPAGLYVLVGAGALMMAVGFFGCCGAMRESQCVLGSVSARQGREEKGAGPRELVRREPHAWPAAPALSDPPDLAVTPSWSLVPPPPA